MSHTRGLHPPVRPARPLYVRLQVLRSRLQQEARFAGDLSTGVLAALRRIAAEEGVRVRVGPSPGETITAAPIDSRVLAHQLMAQPPLS